MTEAAARPTIPLVSYDDVLAARELLADVVRQTPVEHSRPLAERVGGPVYLKCENLQRAGSFKIRGAYVRMSRLTPEERARGVVAASAGNHAQGVALAARLLGIKSVVFMPVNAPIPKVTATKAYGAEVVPMGETVDDGLVAAREYAERTGSVLVHPFDHRDVIAGQGTVGLEILEQCPDARTVVVCTGGGGLISGVSVALKAVRPDIRVVGAQAAGAAAYPGSLAAGHPVPLREMRTMADGIAVGCPGELTFQHVSELVDDIVTVDEEWLSRALLLCLERAKLVVEPAGAAGVAALMAEPHRFEPPVVVTLSGGNIDPMLMAHVIRHGLVAAGRFLALRLQIPDRPGALARLLVELADVGANVVDVEHRRTSASLHLDEVEVAVHLEMRGQEHCEQVLDRLRSAGYRVVVS